MDILFFAAIAVFIFFKLREQLGKVDDEEKRHSIKEFVKEQAKIKGDINPQQQDGDQKERSLSANHNQEYSNNIVSIPKIGVVLNIQTPVDKKSKKILDSLDPTLKSALELVLQRANISANLFLEGAKSAFEMIISAFSIGESSILKPLLSEKIFLQFQAAIEDRKSKNEILNTKIISIDEAKIESAKMEDNFAIIAVTFKSKQINFVENNKSEVIFGSKAEINTVNDRWTFKRDCNSQNPNWTLVLTQ